MTEKYWLTPPDLFEKLNNEFHFDFDPCLYPRPEGFNGIEIPWGLSNYVNPSFRRSDGAYNAGPTAFCRKAIAEQKEGKSSVIPVPTQSYVNLFLRAGAEGRPMGRIKWIDGETGHCWPWPTTITAFILKG